MMYEFPKLAKEIAISCGVPSLIVQAWALNVKVLDTKGLKLLKYCVPPPLLSDMAASPGPVAMLNVPVIGL